MHTHARARTHTHTDPRASITIRYNVFNVRHKHEICMAFELLKRRRAGT